MMAISAGMSSAGWRYGLNGVVWDGVRVGWEWGELQRGSMVLIQQKEIFAICKEKKMDPLPKPYHLTTPTFIGSKYNKHTP
jgi:hypothetical protein